MAIHQAARPAGSRRMSLRAAAEQLVAPPELAGAGRAHLASSTMVVINSPTTCGSRPLVSAFVDRRWASQGLSSNPIREFKGAHMVGRRSLAQLANSAVSPSSPASHSRSRLANWQRRH